MLGPLTLNLNLGKTNIKLLIVAQRKWTQLLILLYPKNSFITFESTKNAMDNLLKEKEEQKLVFRAFYFLRNLQLQLCISIKLMSKLNWSFIE